MMAKRFFAFPAMVLATMGFCACASSTPEQPAAVAKLEVNEAGEYVFEEDDRRNEVVCKRQRVTGSNVPKRVCRTRAQMEKDRQDVLDMYGPLSRMGGDELQRVR